jgi:hypothetical protein
MLLKFNEKVGSQQAINLPVAEPVGVGVRVGVRVGVGVGVGDGQVISYVEIHVSQALIPKVGVLTKLYTGVVKAPDTH